MLKLINNYRVFETNNQVEIENKIAQKILSLRELDSHLVVAVCGAADLGKSFLSAGTVDALNLMNLSASHLTIDSFLMNRANRINNEISGYQPEAYDFNAIENLIIESGYPESPSNLVRK